MIFIARVGLGQLGVDSAGDDETTATAAEARQALS